jgi:hypothetical protein
MKLSVTNRSDGTVEQVFASHADKGVREAACQQSGALSWQVSVTPQPDGGATVEVDRVMAPDVPDYIRKFVGEAISIRQVEHWSAPDAGGGRQASVRLTIKGQPASMDATAVLRPDGDGSTEVLTGEVKVAIPLVGRRIEPEIVKVIESALRIEYRASGDWIAKQG